MKRIRFLIIIDLIMLSAGINSRQKYNSFSPAALWYDNKGVHINAHGGGFIYYAGKYYWFGEHKISGGLGNTAQVGVHCYSSKDLYNWTDKGICMPVDTNVGSPIQKGCIIERPKVIYNKSTDTFVMYFHLELKDKGYSAAQTGIAVSSKVVGPYKFQKALRPNKACWPLFYAPGGLGNRELKHPFSDSARCSELKHATFFCRDFECGQMSRDMTLFVDDDGVAYHIFASEENQTLHIAQLSEDYLSYTGKFMRLFPGMSNEAPAIMKCDGKYYLLTSGCTGWAPNAARLAVATSIWGPWTPLGNPCVGRDADLTFHSQSTYLLSVAGKSKAFIFIADRWNPSNPIDGRYCWLPVCWNERAFTLSWLDHWDLKFFIQNN